MKTFSLSLDDYSPRPQTNNLFWCDQLIKKYPKIKIDLFVSAAYCRLNEKPNLLSENLEWVDSINMLPSNYSVNLHGLYHRRSKRDFYFHVDRESNNDEFEFLSYDGAHVIVKNMLDEFDRSGVKYNMVFRPPGWKLSASAATVLTKRGFIIAGDANYYKQLKVVVPNMRWVSYNWDMTKPCDIDGDVIAYGHVSDWTNNYMNEERYNLICEVLDQDNFDFKFIMEIA
jgi:hypothetical protein